MSERNHSKRGFYLEEEKKEEEERIAFFFSCFVQTADHYTMTVIIMTKKPAFHYLLKMSRIHSRVLYECIRDNLRQEIANWASFVSNLLKEAQ